MSVPQYLKQRDVAVEFPLSFGTINNVTAIGVMPYYERFYITTIAVITPYIKISYY